MRLHSIVCCFIPCWKRDIVRASLLAPMPFVPLLHQATSYYPQLSPTLIRHRLRVLVIRCQQEKQDFLVQTKAIWPRWEARKHQRGRPGRHGRVRLKNVSFCVLHAPNPKSDHFSYTVCEYGSADWKNPTMLPPNFSAYKVATVHFRTLIKLESAQSTLNCALYLPFGTKCTGKKEPCCSQQAVPN